MSDDITKILLIPFAVVFMVMAVIGLDLLLAFPLKWAWNYIIPTIWNLPTINWGQAFCLLIVFGLLIKSTSVSK